MTGPRIVADAKEAVRRARFTTEAESPRGQLALWRDLSASIVDVQPIDGAPAGFNGSMKLYDLDALKFATFTVDSSYFRRTDEHIRKSGIDQWCLSVVKEGVIDVRVDDGDLRASTGSVFFRSFGVPSFGRIERTSFACIYINRDDLWDVADKLDRESHRLLTGPTALILREFVNSVESRLPELAPHDVAAVNKAFTSLLRAALVKDADAAASAARPMAAARFDLARRFINENLKSPNLNSATLCVRLGMSRRQLYYLFEPHGGVASFIRRRRLAACYNQLKATAEKNVIGSTAYEYGFTNLASFYRQFQAQYGLRPSEVRSAWLGGHKPGAAKSTAFADWLAQGVEI